MVTRIAWLQQGSVFGNSYRLFRGFVQAKFSDGGSVLGSNQFSILPQLPLETMVCLKVVKIDLKNKQFDSLI